MNEAKMRAKLPIHVTSESTMEGPSATDILETNSSIEDLPAPTGIREDYSSDEDDDDSCDEEYKGTLTSEDTAAIYSDWVSEMKRIDKQKVAMMLYDNYVKRMGLQKTEAAKEVGLFFNLFIYFIYYQFRQWQGHSEG